ncbi:MAG: hypothetical protein M0000_11300 [Actinomycetota bacterium]|nr:hypothetical protein [Actinomycetota bacterium]MDA8209911.1 hypothetical protein [Actinomycetota bacterium]
MRRALAIGLMLTAALIASGCQRLAVGSHGVWMNGTTYIVGYECPTLSDTSRYLDAALMDATHDPAEVRGDLLLAYASVDQYLPGADPRSSPSLHKVLDDLSAAIVAWSPSGSGLHASVHPNARMDQMVYHLERYLDQLEGYC